MDTPKITTEQTEQTYELLAKGKTLNQAAKTLKIPYRDLYNHIEQNKKQLDLTTEEIEHQRKIAQHQYDTQYQILQQLIEQNKTIDEQTGQPTYEKPSIVIKAITHQTKITKQKGQLYGIETQNPNNQKQLEEQKQKDIELLAKIGLAHLLPQNLQPKQPQPIQTTTKQLDNPQKKEETKNSQEK